MDSAELATPLCAVGNTYSCAVSSATCTPAANFNLLHASAAHTWNAYPAFSTNTTNAKWYWGDGSSSIGFHPNHTYSVTGTYSICVTAYSACGDSAVFCRNNDTSAIYINILNRATTGIEQVSGGNNQVSVYPNPTNGVLNVELGLLNEKTEITIIDVLGNIVMQSIIYNLKSIIDISHLNKGIYFLRVETNEGTTIKKIIKN